MVNILILLDDVKQFQIQDQKAIVAYGLTKKLNSWVQRQFKKVSAISGTNEKAPETFDQAVKSFLGRITTILEETEG